MHNFVVEIRWNRPWESRHGLFKIEEEDRKDCKAAGIDISYDYVLVLKADCFEDLIEIVNAAGVPLTHAFTVFTLDDTTLALLLLHC